MYSIRERKNGKGDVSFQIIVKVVAYNGENVQKAMTWKPQFNLTEKQIQLAVNRVAKEFENKVEAEIAGRTKPIATENTPFNEFAEYWLKNMESKVAPTSFVSAANAFNKIKEITAEYRLKDFVPNVIEEVYKRIEALQNLIYSITAKDNLQSVIKGQYRFNTRFCRASNIGSETLKAALHKDHICYETAKKIADCLSVDMDYIFNVEKRIVPYKSTYIEGMKKVVRCSLTLAARLGIIKRNFAHRFYVTTRHPDAEKVKSMTFEEAQRLLQTCEQLDIRKKMIITFIMFTGVRKGEICGLNWSDIDFNEKKVHITRQYESVSKKGLIVKKPKTESSIREFELSDHLISVLKKYREWYEAKREEMGDEWQGEDNVLVARNGSRLHPTQIRNWLDEALELAGLPHFTVHSLRHTNITLLIASGVSPVTVAGRVGHKKASTTVNIYADFLGSSDREASGIINDYFSKRAENNVS
ncbi:MAG: site-specific integrase [Clostridiales bacterium]|nr:site-specific integrase [Clostridiales bacterium]